MPTFRSITVRAAAAAALATVMTIALLPAATMGANGTSLELVESERQVLHLINDYRDAHGLAPLRMDHRVRRVARARSRDMRDLSYFSHGSPTGQSAGTMMANRGISHWGWGENIGRISFFGWDPTNQAMVGGWKASAGHDHMLLSRDYNYVGVGIARNAYAAYYTLVFVRQPDHTAPRAGLYAAGRGLSVASAGSGPRAVTIRWWGHDRRLQKYTSGLRGFVVQQKTAHGWKTLRRLTKTRELTLNLNKGTYQFRVKAVDRRGNRGIWRKPLTVNVR